jgi:hypothetical protein
MTQIWGSPLVAHLIPTYSAAELSFSTDEVRFLELQFRKQSKISEKLHNYLTFICCNCTDLDREGSNCQGYVLVHYNSVPGMSVLHIIQVLPDQKERDIQCTIEFSVGVTALY